jgi:hypothetical protein
MTEFISGEKEILASHRPLRSPPHSTSLARSCGFFGKEPNCFTFINLLSLDPSSDRAPKAPPRIVSSLYLRFPNFFFSML